MQAREAQRKQNEWHDQWSRFEDRERFLFDEWIEPVRLDDFAGRDVLEVGCGGGQHTSFIAPVAATVTAVDLNTTEIARRRNAGSDNVEFLEADAATMDLGRDFDIVLSIGMIHHTDDPDRTFDNLYRHCRSGGRVIVWTYSAEGNALMRWLVEPARRLLLARLPRPLIVALSYLLTALLMPLVHTVYRIPWLSFLPYYDYFANARRLSFRRSMLNIFDKLNAPQTHFITRRRCEEWFSPERFVPSSISIRPYVGVSYSLTGVKR